MRHVFATMGTIASIALPSEFVGRLSEVESVFTRFEARFSLFRSDSELSRIARKELPLTAASDTLLASYARALEWGSRTDGAFTPLRPDGVEVPVPDVVAHELGESGSVGEHRVDQLHGVVARGGEQLVEGRPDGAQPVELGLVAVAAPRVVVRPEERVQVVEALQGVRLEAGVGERRRGLQRHLSVMSENHVDRLHVRGIAS